MATLHIVLGTSGVEKVTTESGSVSESGEIAKLIEASSLGVRLLHDSVREAFLGVTWSTEVRCEVEEILGDTLRAAELVEYLDWDGRRAVTYTRVKGDIVEDREKYEERVRTVIELAINDFERVMDVWEEGL